MLEAASFSRDNRIVSQVYIRTLKLPESWDESRVPVKKTPALPAKTKERLALKA